MQKRTVSLESTERGSHRCDDIVPAQSQTLQAWSPRPGPSPVAGLHLFVGGGGGALPVHLSRAPRPALALEPALLLLHLVNLLRAERAREQQQGGGILIRISPATRLPALDEFPCGPSNPRPLPSKPIYPTCVLVSRSARRASPAPTWASPISLGDLGWLRSTSCPAGVMGRWCLRGAE